MATFEFTLVIAGDTQTPQTIDALFERGCGDATFGATDGVSYGDFHQEAPSFLDAVTSAIRAVESVPGLRVSRVEPDDLVTAAEIAERLGRTRESVRLLIAGERGDGTFPPPVSHLRTRHRLWRWSDVAVWSRRATPEEAAQAGALAAVNAALEWRNRAAALPAEQRRLIASLGLTA